MDPHHYDFRSVWRADAPPDAVFAVLVALEEYPNWWPQVRSVRGVDPETAAIVIRSVLPISLRITAHSSRRDPAAGVLEARLSGDLDGFSRWTVSAHGGGSVAVFSESVDVRRALLRRLSVARPGFRLNHALMMRRGEAGLRGQLAGPSRQSAL